MNNFYPLILFTSTQYKHTYPQGQIQYYVGFMSLINISTAPNTNKSKINTIYNKNNAIFYVNHENEKLKL